MPEDDAFDRLLLELSRGGFIMPYAARLRDYSTQQELVEADESAWQKNRKTLLDALIKSGWVAG